MIEGFCQLSEVITLDRAAKKMRTRIKLMVQPKSIHSIVAATQRERRHILT